jgi:hypothetical protein
MSVQSSFAWPFICISQTAIKACDDQSTFFWLFHRKRDHVGRNKKQALGGALCRGKETCRVGDDDSRCLEALGCESLTWLVTLQMQSAPWKWLHKHIASEKWGRHFSTWKSRGKANGLPPRREKSEFGCIWRWFHFDRVIKHHLIMLYQSSKKISSECSWIIRMLSSRIDPHPACNLSMYVWRCMMAHRHHEAHIKWIL